MIEKALLMTFKDEGGKNVTIKVKDIKDPLEDTAVKNLMNLIITKNVFKTQYGTLVSAVKAEVVNKESTPVTIA